MLLLFGRYWFLLRVGCYWYFGVRMGFVKDRGFFVVRDIDDVLFLIEVGVC